MKPIIFSGPMVRAILSGAKTQTRRVVKPQPHATSGSYRIDNILDWCPYPVGTMFWVRETWQQVHPCQVDDGRFSLPGRAGIPGPPPVKYRVIYRADGEYPHLHFSDGFPYRERCQPGCEREHLHPEETWNGWASPIHLPRRFARLFLRVTDVRVERLQKISGADAIAEGVDVTPNQDPTNIADEAVDNFRVLWDSLNGKRYPWASNCWVWVYTFERTEVQSQ